MAGKSTPVRAGETIETSRLTRGTMQSESVGRIDIEAESRLHIVPGSHNEHRLALDRGTIHAFVWAPLAQFVVDTPSAKTVDLGCEYTLHVAEDGSGLLAVQMGWVAFEWHGIESFIPAGAACATRMNHGPDTPYFLDAPAQFRRAIAQFDRSGNKGALDAGLRSARKRDALTLWHLLERTRGDQRAAVFSRLADLIRLPPQTTREAILSGDRDALNGAWNALRLGNTDWWRDWKRRW